MELTELYNKIEQYALNTQTVESYKTGDPYVLLNSLHIKYPIFVSALNYMQYQDNVIEAHMSFFMVYKLAIDSSNLYTDQDNAFKVIHNVLNHLVDDYELEAIETLQITPFTQKFADICCGAWCDATVYIPNDENCLDFDKPEPEPTPEPTPTPDPDEDGD